jgi:hypothetical protein
MSKCLPTCIVATAVQAVSLQISVLTVYRRSGRLRSDCRGPSFLPRDSRNRSLPVVSLSLRLRVVSPGTPASAVLPPPVKYSRAQSRRGKAKEIMQLEMINRDVPTVGIPPPLLADDEACCVEVSVGHGAHRDKRQDIETFFDRSRFIFSPQQSR